MLNHIWLGLILLAVLIGGFGGHARELVDGAIKGAETAASLALGLIGIMTLWLGMMRLAEKSGLVQVLARGLRPVLRRLFPEVPVDHPAMGSMVMNIAANMLGLSNAATPLGLRAMKDLESLNPYPGVATNAMCTFLAINTSSVQLIPITAIAVLTAANSTNPTAIVGTAFLATACAALSGIVAVKSLEKFSAKPTPLNKETPAELENPLRSATTTIAAPGVENAKAAGTVQLRPWQNWQSALVLALFVCFVWFFAQLTFPEYFSATQPAPLASPNYLIRAVNAISLLAIPFLLLFFPLYAALRGLAVYEDFVEGAKEGFQVAIRIIPFLVAMLVAIGMFRAAGGIDLMGRLLGPILRPLGFPTELLPISLMRPLSGSASLGLFSEIVKQHGPDSLLARTAGTLYGSTETTFYVLAVYFGSVGIKRTRHAVPAGLIADTVGILASILICRIVFGASPAS